MKQGFHSKKGKTCSASVNERMTAKACGAGCRSSGAAPNPSSAPQRRAAPHPGSNARARAAAYRNLVKLKLPLVTARVPLAPVLDSAPAVKLNVPLILCPALLYCVAVAVPLLAAGP